MLHDVVVGRGEAGALHPFVFAAKVAHGVGDDGGPGLRQCRVGRVLRRRQQVHELPVHGVHGLVIQQQRIGPFNSVHDDLQIQFVVESLTAPVRCGFDPAQELRMPVDRH